MVKALNPALKSLSSEKLKAHLTELKRLEKHAQSTSALIRRELKQRSRHSTVGTNGNHHEKSTN
jgi:hypothetical protein